MQMPLLFLPSSPHFSLNKAKYKNNQLCSSNINNTFESQIKCQNVFKVHSMNLDPGKLI